MRTGGGAVQQALTTSAATIVKQSINLARQRGHLQVTPLHVATTLLASSSGLLRAACLQSHCHPFQCKALELCFNVALNRLPTSSSSSIIGTFHHHHHHLALSNALVAAFKRAQAYQRRGDNQQQNLLTVKIDLDQLIISILDDPSVSRVMREAGFLSTQVKSIIENSQSLDTISPISTPNMKKLDEARDEDIDTIMEALMREKKRSIVLVGECLENSEAVIRRIMDRFDHGDVHDQSMIRAIQFRTLSLSTFSNMTRDEVDQKFCELRCSMKGKDAHVIYYLGDLKLAVENQLSYGGGEDQDVYSSMDHAVVEFGRLVMSSRGVLDDDLQFSLVGVATQQTYMKCKVGRPSLETLWCCHPLSLPHHERLELSLDNSASDLGCKWKSKRPYTHFFWPLKREAEGLGAINGGGGGGGGDHLRSSTSSLPPWLQHYKEANKKTSRTDQDCLNLEDTRKKIKVVCSSADKLHSHFPGKMLNFSSISPSSSIASYDLNHQTSGANQPAKRRCRSRNSASDSMELNYAPRFTELSAENLKALCSSLEEQVPWQKEIIPEIATTILHCRSGMKLRRMKNLENSRRDKEETWLFFLGSDAAGKRKIARDLALLVFGSHNNLIPISSSNGINPSYFERVEKAIRDNPHCVILMEDIDQVDCQSLISIKKAISSNEEELRLSDSIFILSCTVFDQTESSSSCPKRGIERGEEEHDQKDPGPAAGGIDLNLCADDKQDVLLFDELGVLIELVDRVLFFKLPESSSSTV